MPSGVVGELGAVVHRISNTFNLAERIIGIGGHLTHGIGDGQRLVECIINRLADDVTLGVGGLDDVAITVVEGGKRVISCIGHGGSKKTKIRLIYSYFGDILILNYI